MKTNQITRILCMLLAMLMLVCVVSCDKKDDEPKDTTPPTKTVTVNAPEGYAVYKNDDIGFAYPESWTRTDASVVMLIDNSTGNNITVSYEAKSDMYETMTQSEAVELLEMVAASINATVSNVTLAKETNQNGLSLVKIACTMRTSNGVSMKQTMLITESGNQNYVVNVTEVVANSELLQTVINTLVKAA